MILTFDAYSGQYLQNLDVSACGPTSIVSP